MREDARGGTYEGPGDVGRRIAQRRNELGLTRTQLASRTGMAPEYVHYVETRPSYPSSDMLFRVAQALGISTTELVGGRRDVPPGRAAPGPEPELETLDERECYRLISPGGVGRLALATASGPAVLPVNYVVLDGAIVFRTAPDTLGAAHIDDEVGFEVDRIDEAMSEGWSVLVVGRARRVTEPDEVERIRRQSPLRSWAGDERELYVRVDPATVTGRRIRAGSNRPAG